VGSVTILRGAPFGAPTEINARTIPALRLHGSPPCGDGLARGLAWIGKRSLSIDAALEEGRTQLTAGDFEWLKEALGGYGYGYGYGDGDGDGDGYGDGSGYGDGYGYGYGSGYGDGYGYGYGSPDIVHSEPTGLATPVSA
jgi:hypothetical protein